MSKITVCRTPRTEVYFSLITPNHILYHIYISVIATSDIKKGHEITFNYNVHFQASKYFLDYLFIN